jgi:hypothetical protein
LLGWLVGCGLGCAGGLSRPGEVQVSFSPFFSFPFPFPFSVFYFINLNSQLSSVVLIAGF